MRTKLLIALALFVGCGGSPPPAALETTTEAENEAPAPTDEAAPAGQLSEEVTPLHYRLALRVLPDAERYGGEVWIRTRVAHPLRRIFLHGARLTASTATITLADQEGNEVEVPATFEPVEGREELVVLRTHREIPAGEATIHIVFDAPFDRTLKGLYRVDQGEHHYAFTQFEATSARYAFPCFDEPRWKTPFDLELTVHRSDVAVANTREVESNELAEDMKRVRFATTLPLPTYLLALAVGPLDVVEAEPIAVNAVRTRPLPLRGIAAHGRGPELRHALAHTPEILNALEDYFGSEYPFDKLDVVAVPDFAAGAMENAGLVTFREPLLLLGQEPPEDQVRAFTNVMAHELAHQWFGDLVTMAWWDEIWLNEAFATWAATKIVETTHPEMKGTSSALSSIHGAMGQDSLEAARQIRQPIESDHDIRNAFDAITYNKGAGVLAMFEAWLGEETFREGIRVYLRQHRLGTGTSEQLLTALSEAAGRDVATPFTTFLEQPGVPAMDTRLSCSNEGARVEVAQSRYLPIGSSATRERTWSVPFCVSYPVRGNQVETQCELVSEATQSFTLNNARGCPAWLMPNAGARGYYRFSLPPEGMRALLERAWSVLDVAERASVASNLRAAFANASTPAREVLAALPRVASDPERAVATDPMGLVGWLADTVAPEDKIPAARAFAGSLYRARVARLGWNARPNEDGETRLLRRDVLGFMAHVARDPAVRAEAQRRGRAYAGIGGDGQLHTNSVSSDLVGVALSVAVQEGGEPVFDAILQHAVSTEDAIERGRMLSALAATWDPALAQRALDLALDPRLRINEVGIPIATQVETKEGRERAFAWLTQHYDAFASRLATTRVGAVPTFFSGFCDEAREREVESFFAARIETLPGGPRNLRGALETIRLCRARVEAQGPSALEFLSSRR